MACAKPHDDVLESRSRRCCGAQAAEPNVPKVSCLCNMLRTTVYWDVATIDQIDRLESNSLNFASSQVRLMELQKLFTLVFSDEKY